MGRTCCALTARSQLASSEGLKVLPVKPTSWPVKPLSGENKPLYWASKVLEGSLVRNQTDLLGWRDRKTMNDVGTF